MLAMRGVGVYVQYGVGKCPLQSHITNTLRQIRGPSVVALLNRTHTSE